jgi:hypothetical protein
VLLSQGRCDLDGLSTLSAGAVSLCNRGWEPPCFSSYFSIGRRKIKWHTGENETLPRPASLARWGFAFSVVAGTVLFLSLRGNA